jgi:hypothetical protein
MGAGNAPKVTVFSDFHCGYCRALHQTLKAMGVRVTERPISILGTRAISESVICAEDKAAAVERAYGDQDVANAPATPAASMPTRPSPAPMASPARPCWSARMALCCWAFARASSSKAG